MTYPFPGLTGTAYDPQVVIPGRVDPVIPQLVKRLKDKAIHRDEAQKRVKLIREGEFDAVWPGFLPEKYPKSMVANFIDVAARDFAANLAPLPSLACAAGNMRTDVDKRRAERRNRIGGHYWRCSDLAMQMKWGADWYVTYGFLPFYVEANYDEYEPYIQVEDPRGAYFDMDRRQNVVRYVKCWRKNREELAAEYPEYARLIIPPNRRYVSEDVELVRFVDHQEVVLYLPECGNLVLGSYKHGMDRCPVAISIRPGVSHDPRGQFDDVLWIQLGAMVMAALTLEAGHKAVQAPIAAPSDMQELPIGPDAIMVTDNPDKVRRLELDVPSAAFALSSQLQQEMQVGAGMPDTRLGEAPPGGTTGRGVSALQGGFSTQISEGQDMLGNGIRRATEMCFEMEMRLWPNRSKTISGTVSNESFTLTYIPRREFTDNVLVNVSYGFSAGQSPSATIITLLQLRGDQIIGRDTVRRNMPFPIDVDQQQRELDVQLAEDGMKQGLAAGLQAVGQMIVAGRLDVAMQFMNAGAAVVTGRRAGRDLSEILVEAFTPPPAPPEPLAAGAPGAGGPTAGPGGPGGGPGGLPGVQAGGLLQGVAPGQAGLPPGGRPSVTDLAAGFLASGNPSMQATIRQRVPA